MSAEWIDISRPVSPETPVWPGDTRWTFNWAWAVSEGASVNVGALGGSTHTGTHADAPRHLDITAAPIEALPLAAYLGPAAVVDLTAGSGAAGA
ncbi:MAG: cyclase family protein, partial [Gemmatimonadota bacterium]